MQIKVEENKGERQRSIERGRGVWWGGKVEIEHVLQLFNSCFPCGREKGELNPTNYYEKIKTRIFSHLWHPSLCFSFTLYVSSTQ